MNVPLKSWKRIWSKVLIPEDYKNDCWPWLKGKDKDGYGVTSLFNKFTRTHRFAYEFYNGPIPLGMCVCHKCNNPPCMNPYHLYLDTNSGNTEYKTKCGRQTKGSEVNTSILNEEDIEFILMNIMIGKYNNIFQIAKLYDVTRDCVYDMISGKNWKHVTSKFTEDNNVPLIDLKLRIISTIHYQTFNYTRTT